MNAHIDVADCIAWAEAYDGPLFHALLCDPPYELGFMGRAWDRSGIAFNPDTWRALARVLHPGAFGMAFASSRGWHRLAVAIEDAGLIIHPSIFGWAFGSGFPKATRLDTQIDKAAGAVREVVGIGPTPSGRPARRVEDGRRRVPIGVGDGQPSPPPPPNSPPRGPATATASKPSSPRSNRSSYSRSPTPGAPLTASRRRGPGR